MNGKGFVNALIVVDVQKDFLPGGALEVPEGDKVIPAIQELAPKHDVIIITSDWHPEQTEHWNTWQVHCVAGTPGSDIDAHVRNLRSRHRTKPWRVLKGEGNADGYSGFEGRVIGTGSNPPPGLAEFLRSLDVTEVTVVGLALDYCVRYTALDAAEEGFDVEVAVGATRPVEEQARAEVLAELKVAGVNVDG